MYAFFLYKGAVGVASLLKVVAACLQGLPIQHTLVVLHRDMPSEGSHLEARGIALVLPQVKSSGRQGATHLQRIDMQLILLRAGVAARHYLAGLLYGHVDIVLEDSVCKGEGTCSEASCLCCLRHLLKPKHLLY